MAVDTCSGFNLVARKALPLGWERTFIQEAPLPQLAGADRRPLALEGTVVLTVRLANTLFRVQFLVATELAVDVLLGTAFIDEHVRVIHVTDRALVLRGGGALAIQGTGAPRPDPQCRRPLSRRHRRETTPGNHLVAPVHLARPITVPAMAQAYVRVHSTARGLVRLDPKRSLLGRHAVQAAHGIDDIPPGGTFRLFVSNFSTTPRRLPKHTVVAYAHHDVGPITQPGHDAAKAWSAALHIAPTEGAPRPNATAAEAVVTERDPTPHPSPAWETGVDLGHVPDAALRSTIMEMLRKHAKMWDGSLGSINVTEHRIDLEPGTRPMRSMPYRQGPARRAVVRDQIDTMLRAGVIEPATAEWASPVVLVPKKDRTLRFCVDYRRLNAKTVPDTYPLPRMDDCIDSLGEAGIFSTLDCNSGYWQIPVAPEDRDKTTFTSYLGTFRYRRMPFGLRNAPATFQRALDIVLSGLRWQICLVYLDDVIVYSRTAEEHLGHLDRVLSLLRGAGISLKLPKCHFFQEKVDYLGHVVTPGKLAVAQRNADAFKTAKFPGPLVPGCMQRLPPLREGFRDNRPTPHGYDPQGRVARLRVANEGAA